MKNQIEKNKEILWDEIEELSQQRMNCSIADKLSTYRGAYKALCMISKKKHSPYSDSYNTNHSEDDYEHDIIKKAGASIGETAFDKRTAEEWAQHMQNEDGTTGPHWTLEQTKQVQSQKGIDCEPLEFWLALNATYSDLCKVFKKHGIANIDAYVDFALAFWLNDKDAQPDKLARYYEYVVKH